MKSPCVSSAERIRSSDSVVAGGRAGVLRPCSLLRAAKWYVMPREKGRRQDRVCKSRSKVRTFYEVFYGEAVIGALVFSKNY